jgi:hypothetical protein
MTANPLCEPGAVSPGESELVVQCVPLRSMDTYCRSSELDQQHLSRHIRAIAYTVSDVGRIAIGSGISDDPL